MAQTTAKAVGTALDRNLWKNTGKRLENRFFERLFPPERQGRHRDILIERDLQAALNLTARSVSEVMVHVACGTFMLLEWRGIKVPADLYPELPEQPEERVWAIVRKNDELERGLREKSKVLPLLSRALDSARKALGHSDEADIERSLVFFGENTTVRRFYLRLLAHTHEHMGQLIAYMRVRNMSVPWPDWRPDRRQS